MKNITFKDYLQEKYLEQEQIIDNVIPEDFDDWLYDLEIEDWFYYGEKYADLKYVKNNIPL